MSHHHTGKKRPQGHAGVKKVGGGHGNAQGQGNDRQGKEVARACAGHIAQKKRDELLPHHQGKQGKGAQFEQGEPQGAPELSAGGKHGGQQHQQKNGEDVLHHQPAQGHMAGVGVQDVVVGQDAGKHHSAGYRNGHAEHRARQQGKAEKVQNDHAGKGGGGDLDNRAAHGNGPYGQQILQVKVQAHAEHEQDYAEFGKLGSRGRVGHKARRVRPHQHTRQQIAYQGGKAQFLGDNAQNQGGAQAAGQREDKDCFVRHARLLPCPRQPLQPEVAAARAVAFAQINGLPCAQAEFAFLHQQKQ